MASLFLFLIPVDLCGRMPISFTTVFLFQAVVRIFTWDGSSAREDDNAEIHKGTDEGQGSGDLDCVQ